MSKGTSVTVGETGQWYPPERNGAGWAGKLWVKGGILALPDADTLDEAKRLVKRVEQDGEVPCIGCGEWVPDEDSHGRWASRYCYTNGCWDEYKANNSDRCKRCKSPKWQCFC